MNPFPELSIIIIARNEAQNIARAIESVLRAVVQWPQPQVLLVDSASTDETVDIARRYPIDIVRLKPEWPLSASAGRYIGMHYTQGDLVMYLDGDMELAQGWLSKAVPAILERPDVAGVDGYFQNIHVRDGLVLGKEDENRSLSNDIMQVKSFAGAAIYRRSALESVGGFNPYLISEEEPELCIRLRHAGYKLIRVPYLMCTHYGPLTNSFEYSMRRLRTSLEVGYGQVLRYHLGSGLFVTVFRERSAGTVIYLAGVLISINIPLLALIYQSVWILLIWILAIGAVLGAFWLKKRSLRQALSSLFLRSVLAYSAIRGFLMTPRPPKDYPLDAEIVQVHNRDRCGRRHSFFGKPGLGSSG